MVFAWGHLVFFSNLPYRNDPIFIEEVSDHKLPIELGRHLNIAKEERYCNLCQQRKNCKEYHFLIEGNTSVIIRSNRMSETYSTDLTKWDRFFSTGQPVISARRDRRRIGCAQRMKWARAPTRFGPGNYTRPNSTWACTQYTVWRLTWML